MDNELSETLHGTVVGIMVAGIILGFGFLLASNGIILQW